MLITVPNFIAGTVTTLAGSGSYGYQDGSGVNAKFYNPFALTGDSHGSFYTGRIPCS
jgi:hypothetical protein